MPPTAPRGTITIARIPVGDHATGRAVPLRLHFTLLFALPWFAAGFAPAIAEAAGAGAAASWAIWALGGLLAALLFASVALHELAHTVTGVRLGAEVRSITLMFLGGVSEMARPPRGNAGEIAMAAAGPGLSLLLAAGCALLARATSGLPEAVLSLLSRVNLVIGIFNLLPAYPLDGGRILRGALATRLGHMRATIWAAAIGRVVAVGLAAIGILGGLLFVTLVAVFVFFASGAEVRAEQVEARLARVPVARVMEFRPDLPGGATATRPIAEDAPASEALRRMGEEGVSELPVRAPGPDGEGHLSGVVRLQSLQRFVQDEEERERWSGRRG